MPFALTPGSGMLPMSADFSAGFGSPLALAFFGSAVDTAAAVAASAGASLLV